MLGHADSSHFKYDYDKSISQNVEVFKLYVSFSISQNVGIYEIIRKEHRN